MDGPTWTEQHAPSLTELPQANVRDRLARAEDEPMNLVLHGPSGVGKTAAVRALARATHENTNADLVEINVADFFDRTKKEIRDDPRFEQFLQGETEFSKQYRNDSGQQNQYKREWSKADMIAHILKESAANAPVASQFKTIILDNAEAIREDFQQALRRVMERYHQTTQFVIATRQPSKLIPPIRSRCFPVPVRAPTIAETIDVLATVCDREGVDADPDGLEFVASAADGDLRRAILSAQTTAVKHDEITMQTAYETLNQVGFDDELHEALLSAHAGDVRNARGTLDDLLYEEGFDGDTLLREVLAVARSSSELNAHAVTRLHALAGEVDLTMTDGTDDRLHLTHLLTSWAAGRRSLDQELTAG